MKALYFLFVFVICANLVSCEEIKDGDVVDFEEIPANEVDQAVFLAVCDLYAHFAFEENTAAVIPRSRISYKIRIENPDDIVRFAEIVRDCKMAYNSRPSGRVEDLAVRSVIEFRLKDVEDLQLLVGSTEGGYIAVFSKSGYAAPTDNDIEFVLGFIPQRLHEHFAVAHALSKRRRD